MLWVCNQSAATVDILNTATDIVDESVSTELNPNKVVFCSEVSPDDGDGGGSDSGCFIFSLNQR